MTETCYPEPPEGLAEEVISAVDRRLKTAAFVDFFDLARDRVSRVASVQSVPVFALSTRQPVSLLRVHRLRRPSSWSFLMGLDPKPQSDLLAAAGPSSGGGFEYSNILSVPQPFDAARALAEELEEAESIASLEVPSYYLRAFWARTPDPEDDRLVFFGETFGLFPTLQYVELAALVKYINDRLAKGDAAKTAYQEEMAD